MQDVLARKIANILPPAREQAQILHPLDLTPDVCVCGCHGAGFRSCW